MPIINQRIDTFLGLNNMLNPSSAEYREGMAYRSKNARLDEHGLWTAQQDLVNITTPPAILACPHATSGHYKFLSVDGTKKIVTLGLSISCDVGPNKKLYSTDGSTLKNAGGTITAVTPPTFATVAVAATATGRQESGTYYYMLTKYDTTYDAESLPSTVRSVDLDMSSANKCVAVTIPAPGTGYEIRIYRSKRISAADGVYNAANIFYYLGTKTSAGTFTDYQHDTEIANAEYEGRGTDPTTAMGSAPDYLASFNNRMLYFKDNILYWSSSGRPQEVAVEYDITYASPAASVTCRPKLSIGLYGEAKFEIAELDGHKVRAALLLFGKLYIWTDNGIMGYIEATNRLEGYRFHVLRKGVGVTSDKVLALSPYGLFGADRQGIWLLTPAGQVKRLTDNRIDLYAGEDTTFSNLDFTNSFGVWIPRLNEYWWGVSGKIIAYQANRNIFVGPYNYAISGGCTVFINSGAHGYVTGAQTPSPTAKDSIVQYLEFWLGQSAPTAIKERVAVEIVHSETPSAAVIAKVYQNVIASETGATDGGNITYTSSAGRVRPGGVGRFFKLDLTLPIGGAPVAVLNYRYTPVSWSEEEGR